MAKDAGFYLRLADVNLAQGETEATLNCLRQALQAGPSPEQRAGLEALASRLEGPAATEARRLLQEVQPEAAAPAAPRHCSSEITLEAVRKLLVSREMLSQLQSVVSRARREPNATLTLPAAEVLTRLLTTDLDVAATSRVALDLVVHATGASQGFLILADGQQTSYGLADGPQRPPEVSAGVLAEVEQTGAVVAVADSHADPRFNRRASVMNVARCSILCVPVLAPQGSTLVGAIYLESAPGKLGAPERELAATLAALIGPALWKARRFEERGRQLAKARRGFAAPGAPQLLGRSPAIHKLRDLIHRIAPGDHTVLILGESGSGKELVARGIHGSSARATGPFVAENMGALASGVLESELFGHAKGAFTGADSARPGLFQVANGGTLLLDEIGEMDTAVQTKLLRVLEEREVRPVGSGTPVPVDVRILAATNRDLREEVREGRFREDLYYRLSVVVVRVPPLRERREDVPLLLEHFLARAAADQGLPPPTLSAKDLQALRRYDWPGNVRELAGYAVRLLLRGSSAELTGISSPASRAGTQNLLEAWRAQGVVPPLREAREAFDRIYLAYALEAFGGNVSAAAKSLELNRSYLSRLAKRLGLRK